VVELVDETARTKSVVLDVPGWRGHRAGQHVDVRLTAEDGYQAQRSYSIVSAPQLPAPVVRQSSLERIPGRRQLEDLHNLDAQLALVDELCQCDQLVQAVRTACSTASRMSGGSTSDRIVPPRLDQL
jgi:hypothetical protein